MPQHNTVQPDISNQDRHFKTPYEVRLACRENRLNGVASHALPGYLCVNVIILDRDYADEFADFCNANPKPCPIIQRFEPGQIDCDKYAKDLDIRTDLGSYDVVRNGVIEQRKDIVELFNARMVTFLIGSSTSFEGLLPMKGFNPRFIGTVQQSSVECKPVGQYKGKMAVTVRAFDPDMTDKVWEYTSHLPLVHGAPVGKNNWEELGIEKDIDWWGKPITSIPEGTDRLYWGCGVTPLQVALEAKLPFMISYTPRHAMITDVRTESLYDVTRG